MGVRGRTSGHRAFTCFTQAEPAAVWAALTGRDDTAHYLYGLSARSSWEADAAITLETACDETLGRPAVEGQVVHSDPPRRLTYCLTAAAGDPPTYVTWQIRQRSSGSKIRLHIDEPDPDVADTDEEAAETWLPVLAKLQHLLATRPPGPSSGDAQV